MNRASERFDELGLLTAALCDGPITPEQAARLEQLAGQSSQARQFFLRYLQLHGELYWENAASAAGDTLAAELEPASHPPDAAAETAQPGKAARPAGKPPRLPSRWIAALATVASLVLAAWLGVASYRYWLGKPDEPSGPPVVARVAQTFEATWSGHATKPEGNDLAAGQRLTLRSGLAEICFRSGPRVILEGPVSFDVNTPTQGHLHFGSLTVDLSQGAAGFVIDTPNAAIVDRGTQFGVSVGQEGQTEIHVFAGAVSVQLKTASAPRSTWHKVGAGAAVKVLPPENGAAPEMGEIPIDSNRFVRHLPLPGSVAGFRALVARHPDLIHHYTFEGATDQEKRQDKKGSLDLTEVVMYGGSGGAHLEYACPGIDGTTNAIRPGRARRRGNVLGVGLQSEAKAALESEARFRPPAAMTVELLLNFQGFSGNVAGGISTAVATRRSATECGFFVAAVDQGRLVHLMDADAPWVSSRLECIPGDWYYVASTFSVQQGRTIVNTYWANISRKETDLEQVVEGQVAAGEPATGPLGIGKGFAADTSHAYPWAGMLDEVAIYDTVLDREALEQHLQTLLIAQD